MEVFRRGGQEAEVAGLSKGWVVYLGSMELFVVDTFGYYCRYLLRLEHYSSSDSLG